MAVALSVATIAVIVLTRRYTPKVPGMLVAVAGAAAAVALFEPAGGDNRHKIRRHPAQPAAAVTAGV